MQAFLLGFIWFYLHLFGAHSPSGCIGGGSRRTPLRAIRQALDSSPKPAASMARWVLF
jgi:hypothetical protein